jgi:chemotaxis signal transduction protein
MRAGQDKQTFVLARIDTELRLLELTSVREIIAAMHLERPIGVGGKCRGLARLRGELIPVFDVSSGRDGALLVTQLIVIAQSYSSPIGVVVDDVLDIVELEISCDIPHATRFGQRVRSADVAGTVVSVLSLDEVLDAA